MFYPVGEQREACFRCQLAFGVAPRTCTGRSHSQNGAKPAVNISQKMCSRTSAQSLPRHSQVLSKSAHTWSDSAETAPNFVKTTRSLGQRRATPSWSKPQHRQFGAPWPSFAALCPMRLRPGNGSLDCHGTVGRTVAMSSVGATMCRSMWCVLSFCLLPFLVLRLWRSFCCVCSPASTLRRSVRRQNMADPLARIGFGGGSSGRDVWREGGGKQQPGPFQLDAWANRRPKRP